MKFVHSAIVAILISIPLGLLGYTFRFHDSVDDGTLLEQYDNVERAANTPERIAAIEDHRAAVDAFEELVTMADAENWSPEKRDEVFAPLATGYHVRSTRDGWPAAGTWLREQLAGRAAADGPAP